MSLRSYLPVPDECAYLIAMGQVDKARSLTEDVLRTYPTNVKAVRYQCSKLTNKQIQAMAEHYIEEGTVEQMMACVLTPGYERAPRICISDRIYIQWMLEEHAASLGRVDHLRALCEHFKNRSPDIYMAACLSDGLECVKYLDSIGCHGNEHAFAIAQETKNKELMAYLASALHLKADS